jgi:hypothetical protein
MVRLRRRDPPTQIPYLFTWLKSEQSFNRTTKFELENLSIDSGPPLDTRISLQTNNYDCGVFVCLYAAFIDIQHPISFSQHDINNVRAWMAHEMIEEGKLWNIICSALPYSNLAPKTGNTAKRPGDSTTTGRSLQQLLTITPRHIQSSATTTDNRPQYKRQSETRFRERSQPTKNI